MKASKLDDDSLVGSNVVMRITGIITKDSQKVQLPHYLGRRQQPRGQPDSLALRRYGHGQDARYNSRGEILSKYLAHNICGVDNLSGVR